MAIAVLLAIQLNTSCQKKAAEATAAQSPTLQEPGLLDGPHDDLARDLATLTQDEFEGRAAGTAGGQRARHYLRDRMAQVGLRPAGSDRYELPFTARRRDEAIDAANLLGAVPNRRLDQPVHDPITCTHPLVVLSAHYDHLGKQGEEVFNGADDNASGVAAALRIAGRAAAENHPFHLLLALFDAEEIGLQGARAQLEHWPAEVEARIVVNLNLDMVGRSDAGILWIAGSHHTTWLVPIVAQLEREEPVAIRAGRDSRDDPPDWTDSSDHAVFHRADIPFLYFGVDDHADYHRSTDDLEKLDLVFLREVTDVVQLALEKIGQRIENLPIATGG